MSKSIFSALFIVILCYYSLTAIDKNYAPEEFSILQKNVRITPIEIPNSARDTVTEIPIVREFDRFSCMSADIMRIY